MPTSTSNELKVSVKENEVSSKGLLEAVLASENVRQYFKNKRFRVLETQFFEPDEKEMKQIKCQSQFSNFFQIIIYDYTSNRCVHLIIKSIRDLSIEISESSYQPEPNDEEFQEALKILLAKDERIRKGVEQQGIRIYKPMPPTINITLPDGSIERTLSIGIDSKIGGLRSEIIGVNLIRAEVVRLDNILPTLGDNHCGSADANQPTTGKGTAGQSWVTVTQGDIELWKFLVIRPSASSGTKGSGVELKFVDYKGKRVLYQAHVPILNVRYNNDACPGSPFRDWQYQEGMFEAVGNDVAPGIRLCTSPAKTILDSNNDTGNFRGVAIYVKGQEVVLVSEMEAGWYRYISEWRFHTNGTILPRFGFSAVQSTCVCNIHHHHVYWRFDFDIATSGNNIVEEFNDPILIGNSHWHKKSYEIRRLKDAARKRKWKVSNSQSGDGYEIVPGEHDGVADDFGVGDLWVLRYKGGSEIDDGVTVIGGTPAECKANIDKFLTGEKVENQDVVIWYAAHFTHDVSVETGHIVGPTLKPITR